MVQLIRTVTRLMFRQLTDAAASVVVSVAEQRLSTLVQGTNP